MDALLLPQERVAVMVWDALSPVQANTPKEIKPVRGCHILIPSSLTVLLKLCCKLNLGKMKTAEIDSLVLNEL